MYKRGLALSWSKGFTLVELLVVISIIGILISIIIPNLNEARQSSRDAKRISDIKNIQVALAIYYSDNNHYPCDIYINSATVGCLPNFAPTYMSVVPYDPQGTNVEYKYSSFSGTGSINCTSVLATPVTYHIAADTELDVTMQDSDYLSTPDACSLSDAKFDGSSTACTNTFNATDSCYDSVPN